MYPKTGGKLLCADNNLQVVLVGKVFGGSQVWSWKKLEHVRMCMIPTMTQTAR